MSAVHHLSKALDSANGATAVLASAWDAFDLAGQAADAVAWETGSDELQALTAAQACTDARALLPIPQTGRPAARPAVGREATALAPYVGLMRRTGTALAGLDTGEDAESRRALQEASRLAAVAADALGAVRKP
ncbi:hypothetical protein OG275_38225 (plasmid) [Streptomyces niveus]|uniref:hypothetical protein n=1 Tax=Streptomyces niveus TaxID=193462 RepID=UPI002E367306|nr:hypothetical protein [Streptomyces niveus]